MRIAVVEDDRRMARLVSEALAEAGNDVQTANDAPSGQELTQSKTFDVIVLDVMLPGWSGIEFCRHLRERGTRTPIFAVEELLARVRALGRRSDGYVDDDQIQVGDLLLDGSRREVRRAGQVIELTAREFALLEFLMQHAGRVLSRDQISRHVWGYAEDLSSNVVETYVHYLRDKIDHGFPRPLIRTVRGAGYMIKA
ncbi:MAG: response regulator transcription factor [Chloroflexi bacterium]|nr:response regulator transcription factor [Chloroflexota bacterium]